MTKKLRFVLVILFLYLAAFGQFNYNQIALYVFWPLVLVFTGINIKSIYNKEYCVYYIRLWLFFILSWILAINETFAFAEIKMMLGVLLAVVTFYTLGNKYKNIPWMYGSFIVFYIGMIYYIYRNDLLADFDYQTQRLDAENLNANFFGYYTFYLTFSVFIMRDIITVNRIKKIFEWLFFLMVPLSAIIALLTASRQILIVQIPIISLLLLVRYNDKNKRRNLFFALLLLIFVWIAFGHRIENIFDNSMLNQRAQMDTGEDARTVHLIRAIQIGCENLIFGVGPGCYKHFSGGTFSHCSYTELFANYGLCAALFYIWMLFHFVKTQWNRYKIYNDKVFLSFCTFGVIFIIDNMFYVFYTGMWLMAFFFLVVIHSEHYYLNLKSKK